MFLFVLSVHFVLCALLVGLVLIQQGKGADMGAAFGAGGSNSLFGAGGATSMIVRITTAVAVAFMVTSIVLINLSGAELGLAANSGITSGTTNSGSVMESFPVAAPASIATASEATPSGSTSDNVSDKNLSASVSSAVVVAPAEAPKAEAQTSAVSSEAAVK